MARIRALTAQDSMYIVFVDGETNTETRYQVVKVRGASIALDPAYDQNYAYYNYSLDVKDNEPKPPPQVDPVEPPPEEG